MESDVVTERSSAAPGPRWARVALAAAVVVAVALGAWFLLRGDGDTVTGADGQPVEVIARAEGFALTGSVLTDEIDPATGEPGEERRSFAPGETVRYWLAFDDSEAQPGKDTLFVVFTREGSDDSEPLFRAPFRLPQPIGQQNVSLGAGQTEVPGEYRVTVLVNEEEIHSESFEVG